MSLKVNQNVRCILIDHLILLYRSYEFESREVNADSKGYIPRGVNVTIKDVPELELFLPRDILEETPEKFFFIKRVNKLED